MNECPLCDITAECMPLQHQDGLRVACTRCGEYLIHQSAIVELEGRPRDQHILSGITRVRSNQGSQTRISSDNIDDLLSSIAMPRDPQEVLDRFILHVGSKARAFTDRVQLTPETDYPIAFARKTEDFAYALRHGRTSALVDTSGGAQLTGFRGYVV